MIRKNILQVISGNTPAPAQKLHQFHILIAEQQQIASFLRTPKPRLHRFRRRHDFGA
jgi:hypothetical protein